MIGTVGSSYHTPGNFIDGQAVNQAEMTISIDGLLVAPVFVAKIDELMNHYDVRGPYSEEMGRELAQQYDQNVARTAVLAARASNVLTGRSGGSRFSHADMATSSTQIAAGIFSAAQALDEKKISSSDRNCFVKPAHYYLCAQDTTLINKDYNGMGSIAAGRIETVAGIDLVKTNNVPSVDDTSNTDIDSKYRADFSATIAIIMNRMAVGTVQLMDIAVDSDWETRRRGTFMVAEMAVGHGILRADCAVELYDV